MNRDLARKGRPPTDDVIGGPPASKRAFLDEYRRLVASFARGHENPGSYSCRDCERCAECMFCEGCSGCYRCTHCMSCEACNHCTNCISCIGCSTCAKCEQCEGCTGSNYLLLCTRLSDCNYCIGCVGLAKKDFHILNEPYPRAEYFRIVARLRKDLGL